MKTIRNVPRRMTPFLLFCLVSGATAYSGACCDIDRAVDTAELQIGLDDLVEHEVEDNSFLATGVTVRLADGRVLRSAAGHTSPNGTADYDVGSTEQVIGSVTKLYTTVLIMQLVEAGQIGLDATIDRWLSFDGAAAITIRMLLTHTSGLNEYLDHLSLEQLGQSWTPEELLEVALARGPLGEPGMAQAIYTNTNFLVLGMVFEAETGVSWQDGVQERIAQPLGLRHTYYAGQANRAAHLASGWMQTDQGWIDVLEFVDPSVGWGVGAMVTTNDELRRFTEALFAGELFESPATLEQMTSYDTEMNPAYLGMDPPSWVGLAVTRMSVDGLRLDGHLGHAAGYNSAALRDPDTGDIIVVTSNDDAAYSGFTAQRVAEFLRSH